MSVCRSTKSSSVALMVLVIQIATSLTVAANNDGPNNLPSQSTRVNNIYSPNVTLDTINRRLDILFGRERSNQKILTDMQQRFTIFENHTKEQTVMISEIRQLENNQHSVQNNIESRLVSHQDMTQSFLSDIKTTQLQLKDNLKNLNLMFDQLQQLVESSNAIKNELQESKIQQIFKPNENRFQVSPQIPFEFLLPIGCDTSIKDGIYRVKASPESDKPFYSYCKGVDEGAMWTVILSRVEDDTSFLRGWTDYKFGFGNINKSFWIGLDRIHEITSSKLHELMVTLEDFQGNKKQAKYSIFAVADEEHGYALELLGSYTGNAGDSLSYHAGQKFSTIDLDNDNWEGGSCALSHTGGWWYNQCDHSNLCGVYLGENMPSSSQYQGVYWNDFHGPLYSLKSVHMMIRPISNQ